MAVIRSDRSLSVVPFFFCIWLSFVVQNSDSESTAFVSSLHFRKPLILISSSSARRRTRTTRLGSGTPFTNNKNNNNYPPAYSLYDDVNVNNHHYAYKTTVIDLTRRGDLENKIAKDNDHHLDDFDRFVVANRPFAAPLTVFVVSLLTSPFQGVLTSLFFGFYWLLGSYAVFGGFGGDGDYNEEEEDDDDDDDLRNQVLLFCLVASIFSAVLFVPIASYVPFPSFFAVTGNDSGNGLLISSMTTGIALLVSSLLFVRDQRSLSSSSAVGSSQTMNDTSYTTGGLDVYDKDVDDDNDDDDDPRNSADQRLFDLWDEELLTRRKK